MHNLSTGAGAGAGAPETVTSSDWSSVALPSLAPYPARVSEPENGPKAKLAVSRGAVVEVSRAAR